MKKNILAILLTVSMTVGLCGCGADSASSGADTTPEKESTENISEEEPGKDASNEADATEDETPKDVGESSFAAKTGLGFNRIGVNDGFKYLMEYELTTDSTPSGDEVAYTIYIPDDEYPTDYGWGVSSEQFGVSFDADTDVILESENNTVEKNLEYEIAFDWSSISEYYYAVSIGDVQSVGNDMAVGVVSYIRYSNVFDEYESVYRFYCMLETPDKVPVLLEVEIDSSDTTDETPELLAELESFYGFNIGWDAAAANDKLEEFMSDNSSDDGTFNLGYMTFELPDGWNKDVDKSPYTGGSIFAPNGNSDSSHTSFLIQRFYVEEDIMNTALVDTKSAEAHFENAFSNEVAIDNMKVTEYGDTFIGRTLEIYMELSQGGESAVYISYVGQVDNYMYEIDYLESEASEAERKEALDAIELMFKTAKLK